MKTRNGFVSNSSTSSFVIIGFETDKDYEELSEYESRDVIIETEARDKTVIGIKIARWSDDDAPDIDLTMDDLNKKTQEARELGTKLGINVDPKMFIGSCYC